VTGRGRQVGALWSRRSWAEDAGRQGGMCWSDRGSVWDSEGLRVGRVRLVLARDYRGGRVGLTVSLHS